MAIPVVTCSADIIDVAGSLPRLTALSATATGSPTGWQWTMLGIPAASSADVGTNGDFVNGVASIQNPSFTADADGTYCIQAVATNASGSSNPSVDRDSAQQNTVIKTATLALEIPDFQQFDWNEYMNRTIRTLEASAGAIAAHDLGGAFHNADTIANLNTKVSDRTLDGTVDPRPADEIIETDGPTIMAVGDVLDTQFLRREGSTVIGEVLDLSRQTTAAGVQYYVDGTRPDDTGDGLSWGTAKKNFQAGHDASPPTIGHNTTLNMRNTISHAANVIIRKAMRDNALFLINGEDDVTVVDDNGGGNYVADIGSTSTIGKTGSSWTIDANSGYLVENITTGEKRLISKIIADTIYPQDDFGADTTGDTFRIVKWKTVVQDDSSYKRVAFECTGNGEIVVQRINFTNRAYLFIGEENDCHVRITACEIDMASGVFAMIDFNRSITDLHHYVYNPATYVIESGRIGTSFMLPAAVLTVGSVAAPHSINIYGALLKNVPTLTNSILYTCYWGTRYLSGLVGIKSKTASSFRNSSGYFQTTVENASGNGIDLIDSQFNFEDIDISNCNGHGIDAQNSTLNFESATLGSGNTGHGVNLRPGSSLTQNTGTPPTLTGAGGNVLDDATTKTWAQVGTATGSRDDKAIHFDRPNEINQSTSASAPEPTDILALEIAALSWEKRKALISAIISSCVILQNGFDDRADSTLSWDDGTRTFTITPVGSFTFWSGDPRAKFTKSSPENIVLPDVEALYFIYYDSSAVLQQTTSFTDAIVRDNAFVAAVYWDDVNSEQIQVTDERHGREMTSATHLWAHNTLGCLYDEGLALSDIQADGTGNDDADAQCSCLDGAIRDEDIVHIITDGSPQDLAPILQAPILYRLGVGGLWRKLTATNFTVSSTGTGRAAYNLDTAGTWSIAEVANNDYTLSHVFATGDIINPIIIIMGQATYGTITDARAGAFTEINTLALGALKNLFVEFKAIGTFIFQTSNGYSNTVQSRVRTTELGEDYVDFRFNAIGSSGAGASSSDHDSIANNGGVGSHAIISTFLALLTTKGDLRVYDDNLAAEVRLRAGTIGQHLEADPAEDTGMKWATPSAGGGDTVKVSANDTTAGYLNGKLTAGPGIILTENNDGSNEDLAVSIDGSQNAPGSRVTMFEEIPGSDRTTTSATFVDITDLDGTFDILAEGLYDLALDIQGILSATDSCVIEWQLVFDAAGTPQTIGSGNGTWLTTFAASGDREAGAFHAQVQLALGSHTVKLQWRRVSGSGTPTFSTTVSSGSLYGNLVTGSGAGGILDPIEQTLTTQRLISSTTAAAIPTEPMSITFEANVDEVMTLGYKFRAAGPGGIDNARAQLRLDGSLIGDYSQETLNATDHEATLHESKEYKIATSGTHTLDLYCWTDSGESWNIQADANLFASQYRGGLVPYRDQSDVLVQDKPTSIRAGVGINFGDSDGQVAISSDNIAVTSDLNFSDGLDDNVLNSVWTKDIPTVGTVDEQNGRLEIAHTGGTSLDWYNGVNFNAPGAYLTVEPADFVAKVFVDNVTATNDQHAAMILHLNGTDASFHRFELYYNSGYKVHAIDNASVGGFTTVGQDSLWLCIMRRGNRIYYLYSTAAKTAEPELNDMTTLASHPIGVDSGFSVIDNRLSLRGLTSSGTPAFTNYWNNFSILYESETAAKFNAPENMPILEYSSATVVNIISAPGADTRLITTLNDGAQYEAQSPLTMDITVSGLGGLEASASEASDTFYYIYQVKSTTAGEFDIIASPNAPIDGGPDDYTAWRAIGEIRNDASSNILEFTQLNDKFQYVIKVQTSAITADSTWNTMNIDSLVPKTCGAAFVTLYDTHATLNMGIRPVGATDSLFFTTPTGQQSLNSVIDTPDSTKQFEYKVNTGGTGNLYVTGWINSHLSKNRTMPLFNLSAVDLDNDSYKGHMEDTPPTSPHANDEELDDGVVDDLTWDGGAGAPSGGNEAWSLDNDRLTISFDADNATFEPTTYGHMYNRSVPSGDFLMQAKISLRTWYTGNIAGLIIKDADGSDAFTFGLKYTNTGRNPHLRTNSRVTGGSWSGHVDQDNGIASTGVILTIKWIDSTNTVSAYFGFDQEILSEAVDSRVLASLTPTKGGIFVQAGSTSGGGLATLEWLRFRAI